MNPLKQITTERQTRRGKIYVIEEMHFYHLLVGVFVMIILAGCGGVGETAVSPPLPNDSDIEEMGMAVSPTISQNNISALATIKPIEQLNLSFGAGAFIDNVPVRVGELVTAGQLLAALDTTELELELQMAQEDTVIQQGNLAELTSETYAAQATLENQKAIAQVEVDLLIRELALEKAILTGSDAEVIQAQARVDELALYISQGWASLPDDAVAIAQAEVTRAQIAYDEAAYEFQKSVDRHWEKDDVRDAYQSGLTQAELNLQQIQAALAAAQGNESAHAVGVNIYDAQKQQAEWQLAQVVTTQQTYTSTLAIMKAEIAVTQLELEQLQAWQNPYLDEANPGVQKAEARLRQAQIEVARLEDDLAKALIEAPFAGVITAVYLKPGEWANAGTPVVEIIDTSSWLAETSNVSELQIGQVAIGQKATVRVPAVENAELGGKVAIVSPIAVVQQGDTTYSLTIALDATDLILRPGMNAQVSITIDQ